MAVSVPERSDNRRPPARGWMILVAIGLKVSGIAVTAPAPDSSQRVEEGGGINDRLLRASVERDVHGAHDVPAERGAGPDAGARGDRRRRQHRVLQNLGGVRQGETTPSHSGGGDRAEHDQGSSNGGDDQGSGTAA